MARVHLLLCFTLLFASVTLFDVASAFLKLKPSLHQIEDPKTVGDVEGYTVKVVMVFVADLEKECPKTSKFKIFFDKLRGFAKYVCPLKIFRKKEDDADMKAKEEGILKSIASFAVGRIKAEIQEEKMEAIQNFKFMKSLAGRIVGAKKEEDETTKTLTAEQQKDIKEGILKWQTVITKITNTMVVSTTTTTNSQGSEGSDTETTSPTTTGSSPNSGASTGSPSNEPSGSNSGAGTPSKDTNNDQSEEKTNNSASSGSVSTSQTKEVSVTEVETQSSEQIMTFLMNLEKKCPQKDEYKQFFEQLKGTMTGSAKVTSPKKKKGLFARIKGAVGKVTDAMQFIRSRISSKSAEVKTSMEKFQAEVIKNMEELDAIHAKIVSENQSKKGGTMTCSPEQQAEIKTTITKWEQVTTQFVEVAIKSETSTTTSSTSTSTGTANAN